MQKQDFFYNTESKATKDIHNVTKYIYIFFPNKCCSFELSIRQRVMADEISALPSQK